MKHLKETGMLSVFLLLSTSLLNLGLSGGPIYPGTTPSKKVSVFGTYAGVMTPAVPANSLGLFTLVIPTTGLGSGTVSLFLNGNAYTGTMQATGDPDSKIITAFINAQFSYTKNVPSGIDSTGKVTFNNITVAAVATGGLTAKVKKSGNNSQTPARLNGATLLTFDQGSAADFHLPPSLIYTVVGFKQSS